MDVLIKNMKMPKCCEDCWMTYEGDSDNCPVVNESVVKYMVEEKRHPNCPLVALPPHGRLIEGDELADVLVQNLEPMLSVRGISGLQADVIREVVDAIVTMLRECPTVLEAST